MKLPWNIVPISLMKAGGREGPLMGIRLRPTKLQRAGGRWAVPCPPERGSTSHSTSAVSAREACGDATTGRDRRASFRKKLVDMRPAFSRHRDHLSR